MANRWARLLRRRPAQLRLPFLGRRERLERLFRRGIIAATVLGLAGIWLAIPDGRLALTSKGRHAKWAVLRAAGLEPDRAEVDADWAERRARREIRTREAYRAAFDRMPPKQRALLEVAGVGPDDAVVRWGNYDRTFVLSSRVFENDDTGRSYRFRPGLRSFFLRQIPVVGLDTCQFFLPDVPEVRERVVDAGFAFPAEGSQSINSWGCRGGEPDLTAPVRGIVLGDSFMQGYLLEDDQTPPLCLERSLRAELGVPTTILNTGTLGYSPEHYLHTLEAFGDRFRPQFVVVAVYVNDFGDEEDVFQGAGDWAEGKHWLDQILWYCRSRDLLCLIAPVPAERQITGPTHLGDYPGQVSNITGVSSRYFCDPTDQFATEDLRINLEEHRRGQPHSSTLFNGALADPHLSPRGAALWGRIVGQRLALLLKGRKSTPLAPPKPPGPSGG